MELLNASHPSVRRWLALMSCLLDGMLDHFAPSWRISNEGLFVCEANEIYFVLWKPSQQFLYDISDIVVLL